MKHSILCQVLNPRPSSLQIFVDLHPYLPYKTWPISWFLVAGAHLIALCALPINHIDLNESTTLNPN